MQPPSAPPPEPFEALFLVLEKRYRHWLKREKAASYTLALFEKGDSAICQKIVEEAKEVAAAVEKKEGRRQVVHEIADLLFHVFVLMTRHRLPLSAVRQELRRRFGVSGLVEKASRRQKK